MIRFALASAAVAVAILSAGTASASDYRIAYGDLNLEAAEGAAHFDRRVRLAADAACAGGSPVANNRCRAEFRQEAMSGLPDARRLDYARARSVRLEARASSDPA